MVAALRLRNANATATFIEQVLDWWKLVNVSSKGEDIRFNDPRRCVQYEDSTSLAEFQTLFKGAASGFGKDRIQCLTHDTKKALVQTTDGLVAVCKHLTSQKGYKFVLLRQLQSDRIEGEFSVYRQSTGANAFMRVGDVYNSFKQRLSRFAASYLEFIDSGPSDVETHTCTVDLGQIEGQAATIERCVSEVTLSGTEQNAVAYVAGWLETKCDLTFSEEEPLVPEEVRSFIEEVSRGSLKIPHQVTYELVKAGLCVAKTLKVCCRKKMMDVLDIINLYYEFGLSSSQMMRRLANVLLHGIHKLDKDHQKNSTLYQTSVKKARLAE